MPRRLRADTSADAADRDCACSRARKGGVRIEVFDNGPGIDPDRREDIFLPFYTTRADGNGVGLSFARQVIIAHGGSITAATSPLGGASIIAVIA